MGHVTTADLKRELAAITARNLYASLVLAPTVRVHGGPR